MNELLIKDYNDKLIAHLKQEGYENLRALDDGTVIGTSELMFTRALYIGLNYQSWEKRFCFQDRELAITELAKIQEADDEPEGYIARRRG